MSTLYVPQEKQKLVTLFEDPENQKNKYQRILNNYKDSIDVSLKRSVRTKQDQVSNEHKLNEKKRLDFPMIKDNPIDLIFPQFKKFKEENPVKEQMVPNLEHRQYNKWDSQYQDSLIKSLSLSRPEFKKQGHELNISYQQTKEYLKQKKSVPKIEQDQLEQYQQLKEFKDTIGYSREQLLKDPAATLLKGTAKLSNRIVGYQGYVPENSDNPKVYQQIFQDDFKSNHVKYFMIDNYSEKIPGYSGHQQNILHRKNIQKIIKYN